MKYIGAVISVADTRKSRKFYEDLFGLEVLHDYGRNVDFGCLALMQEFDWLVGIPKEKILNKPNNIELYFEEDLFDDFLKKLEKYPKIEQIGGVKEMPWGQRVIRFYDPDDHIIEVGEAMKVVVNRFLSSGMSKEKVAERINATLEDVEKILK